MSPAPRRSCRILAARRANGWRRAEPRRVVRGIERHILAPCLGEVRWPVVGIDLPFLERCRVDGLGDPVGYHHHPAKDSPAHERQFSNQTVRACCECCVAIANRRTVFAAFETEARRCVRNGGLHLTTRTRETTVIDELKAARSGFLR